MTARGVICAGNWIVDIVHNIPVWPNKSELVSISEQTVGVGGGAANVAFDLAALDGGYPVHPFGVLGDDDHGAVVWDLCETAGLATGHLRRLPGQKTAHTHVMNVVGDCRTFFYYPGANDAFGAGSLPLDDVAGLHARIFYLGYLTLLPLLDAPRADGRTGAAELLAKARQAGMMTCVDLVSSQSETYAQTVFGTLPEIDWLFLNEVEAARATGIAIQGETDRDNMAVAAAKLIEGGLGQGCILHTPQLSLWKTAAMTLWFDMPQIPKSDIVSHVGAGDAFAAGVIHGLHEGWSPQDCVALGNRLAVACLRTPTATGGIPTLASLHEQNEPAHPIGSVSGLA